jgi:hypothetical protein
VLAREINDKDTTYNYPLNDYCINTSSENELLLQYCDLAIEEDKNVQVMKDLFPYCNVR